MKNFHFYYLVPLVTLLLSQYTACEKSSASSGLFDPDKDNSISTDSDSETDSLPADTSTATNDNTPSDFNTDSEQQAESDTETESAAETEGDTESGVDTLLPPDTDSSEGDETDTKYLDQDSDDWFVDFDCDDNNPNVNPDMAEVYDPPNNVDDDCDGFTDEKPEDIGPVIETSYIWIANSEQGTVSKIDTRELLELGRYWVRPDHGGSPSRTSVNLEGDVAVAARAGGITKFYANPDHCKESNGKADIQTSSGASNILDWNQEECRAWHTPFSYTSMRALAWTSDGKLWASGSTGTSESSVLEAVLINGETGAVEETITFDTARVTAGSHGHGGYGGVVDGENNFWIAQIYGQKLIKVNYSDMSYKVFDEPTGVYGVTLDEKGRIWTCNTNVAYFDPLLEKWSSPSLVSKNAPFYGLAGGCTSDGNGHIWVSVYDTLYAVNIDDFSIVDSITNLPKPKDTSTGTDSYWGVAIDVDGYVWTIPRYGSAAYKIDPQTHDYESVTGLVGAYTYSDMTGFLLKISLPPV